MRQIFRLCQWFGRDMWKTHHEARSIYRIPLSLVSGVCVVRSCLGIGPFWLVDCQWCHGHMTALYNMLMYACCQQRFFLSIHSQWPRFVPTGLFCAWARINLLTWHKERQAQLLWQPRVCSETKTGCWAEVMLNSCSEHSPGQRVFKGHINKEILQLTFLISYDILKVALLEILCNKFKRYAFSTAMQHCTAFVGLVWYQHINIFESNSYVGLPHWKV